MDALCKLCDSIQKMLFNIEGERGIMEERAIFFDDEVGSLTKKKN